MSARQLGFVHPLRVLSIAVFAKCFAALAAPSIPQAAHCPPSWIPTFGALPGVDGTVYSMTTFDDGSGPALYVGGNFAHAGGGVALCVAKWNGSSWSPLYGIFGIVNALTVFDDGSGPALYAGGSFGVAKWNGTIWTYDASGPNGSVFAFAEFDDPSGPALYAGGIFTTAGGVAARSIAKWDGSAWSTLGPAQTPGVSLVSAIGTVFALTVFDDGTGDALYVGGNFTSAGTTPANHIARWDGFSWSAASSGLNGHVSSMTVFDNGGSSALCVGGDFTTAGGAAASHIAKWDGSNWSPLGTGWTGDVFALTEFNDGTGRALYAGSQFPQASGSGLDNIAKWNGTSWSAVGSGMNGGGFPSVRALTTYNDGNGKALYAGGFFQQTNGIGACSIARWKNSTWSTLGDGLSAPISAMSVFNDGSGPALFVGGSFASISSVAASHIAKWNGSNWSTLGSGVGGSISTQVKALAEFDDGTGSALYVGGYFTTAGGTAANHIAKWDGSNWSPLGSGMIGPANFTSGVSALAVFDDGAGPALYAGGYFTTAGGVTVNHIAKWNGSVWSALGSGMAAADKVNALAVFDDGTGPALYAAGWITTAGGAGAVNIAKWNGSSWSGLGNTMTAVHYLPFVSTLSVFDNGTGAALYVGGLFRTVAGVTVNHLAKWNGSTWSALGSGFDNINDPYGGATVAALATFDEGSGPKLFAMGDFTTAGGVAVQGIARWSGSTWSPVGQGLSNPVAGAVFDDSSGPALYVGGGFGSALNSHDSFVAKWGCPFLNSGATYCTTGTTSNGCVPIISANGSASATAASGFSISINTLESHRLGVIFYGIHGQLAHPWGAGGASLLCVKAPTQRLHPYDSGGSPGLCNGLISEDWNLFIATHASALGQPFLGGETVWAQGWFRDPPSAKTTGLSNGLVFAVAP